MVIVREMTVIVFLRSFFLCAFVSYRRVST